MSRRIAGAEVLCDTDIFISPYIFISAQMRKRKPQIIRLLPAINNLLDEFNNKPVVRFCSFKGPEEGFSYESGLDIEVNLGVLLTDLDILETVAHECVHSKQFQTQRLIPFQDGYFWDKSFVKDPTTDEEYRALPWEREAYSKQTPLARKAAKQANIYLPKRKITMTPAEQVFDNIATLLIAQKVILSAPGESTQKIIEKPVE